MARNQNFIVFEGNLTQDPEVQRLQSGTAVVELWVANNDTKKQGDEWVDLTTFATVKAFGRTAEIIGEYLSKGSRIVVHGKLRMDQWEKDGQKRTKHYILVEQLFLPPKKQGGGDGSEYDQSGDGGVRRGQQRRGQQGGGGRGGSRGGDSGGGEPQGNEEIPF